MTALPPGFSVEAFAKEWQDHDGERHGAMLESFGHALLEALGKAKEAAGSKPPTEASRWSPRPSPRPRRRSGSWPAPWGE